jgi:hypothetical protein
MNIYHDDYLYGFKLNSIDNIKLMEDCLYVENFILKNFQPLPITEQPDAFKIYGNNATAQHPKYNLFTFPIEQLNKLYYEIVKNTCKFLNKEKCYMLKSWLNVFRKGQKINWHSHWGPQFKVWHGFYCVNTEESYTEYSIPNVKDIIKVKSENGLLVFGKSDGDLHKSSEWQNNEVPRITIAFDVVPIDALKQTKNYKLDINHFIPFKINE